MFLCFFEEFGVKNLKRNRNNVVEMEIVDHSKQSDQFGMKAWPGPCDACQMDGTWASPKRVQTPRYHLEGAGMHHYTVFLFNLYTHRMNIYPPKV